MKEKRSLYDGLQGIFYATSWIIAVIFRGLPHLFESKDPGEIERIKKLENEVLPLVGKRPIADLERKIGVDRYDYSTSFGEGYSMSELYKGPTSRSEWERDAEKVEKEYQRKFKPKS